MKNLLNTSRAEKLDPLPREFIIDCPALQKVYGSQLPPMMGNIRQLLEPLVSRDGEFLNPLITFVMAGTCEAPKVKGSEGPDKVNLSAGMSYGSERVEELQASETAELEEQRLKSVGLVECWVCHTPAPTCATPLPLHPLQPSNPSGLGGKPPPSEPRGAPHPIQEPA